MALTTNQPDVERVQRALKHTALAYGGGADAADLTTLAELLTASVADIELKTSMLLDGRALSEVRDGNGTDSIQTFWGPITHVSLVKVELPVLALTRNYTTEEIKVYGAGRRIRVFTFKLAAEHATLHLDAQVYAQLLPSLPKCVFIDYVAGFARYDPDADYTSLDGSVGAPDGLVRLAGDQRDPRYQRWLIKLQQAAIFDTAATYLACVARNEVGLAGSVSFDGYSKGLNPQAFGPAVEDLVKRRDELLAGPRAHGGIWLSTSI